MSSFKVVLEWLAAGEITVFRQQYVIRGEGDPCFSMKDVSNLNKVHVFLSFTVAGD